MSRLASRPADTYSPLYFLASLGAGGLTVTFFMMLMFWVPHTGRPVPVFEDIALAFDGTNTALKAAMLLAMIGIAGFALLNVTSLIWNLRAASAFRKTPAYAAMNETNGQSAMLAMPLALAMTVNALFIVGLVFVPGLWSIVEYLFPFAMIAFLAIGVLALRQIGAFLGRILTTPGAFAVEGHNSFAQLMPAFALAMIAVGLAAPAAMSTNTAVVGVSVILSTFFSMTSVIYALKAAITAVNAMLTHGTAREAAPTLMVIVPLMTVLGIMSMRQTHGLDVLSGGHTTDADTFLFLTRLLSIQLVFAGLGMIILIRQRYFTDFVFGTQTSPGSYALVCPGVALTVMIQFWLNKGLVAAGFVDKFSVTYWAVTAVALVLQASMVALVLRLNRQHFGTPRSQPALAPGE
jgi:hypothetical protein